MKRIILFLALTVSLTAFSQISDPVKWATSVKKISATEYDLIATATISSKWHLYSQSVPKNGPIATKFVFASNANYLKKGNTKQEAGHTVNDPVFDMKITYFEKKASFTQRIKLKNTKKFKINATVEFMACNDTQCLPPSEVDLVFDIK